MSTTRSTSKKIFPILNIAITGLIFWGFGVQSLAQEVDSSVAEEALSGTTEELQEGSLVEEGINTNIDNNSTTTVNPTGSINPGISSDSSSVEATEESGLDANVDATDESGLDANVEATEESGLDANVDATQNEL